MASIVSANETLHHKADTVFEDGSAFGVWSLPNNYSHSDDLDDSLPFLYLFEGISTGGVAFFYFTPTSTHPTDTAYVIRAPPIFSS